MEEVIAKRHTPSAIGYAVVIVIGLLLLIIGSVVGAQMEEKGAILISVVVGGIILAMGVYYMVTFFMIPAKAIVYKDGVLYLPKNVTCRPEELEKVFIKIYKNAKSGAVTKYGKMEITVHGKIYKYNNIGQVKKVQERLLELNRQAIQALNQPEPDLNTQAKPEEDPFGEAEAK